jgi:non-specific serine/threonine protein kinase
LAALVEQSLLLRLDPDPEAPRFSMLESIREFGLERLEASGSAAAVRRRHALYFAWLAEQANVELLGPGLRRWLDRLERDHENLRAAFAWALAAGERELAVRLGTALWIFWFTRGYPAEGLEWMDRLLALGPDDLDPGLWGRVYFVRAFFRWVVGDDEAAIDDAEEAVALGQRGDTPLTQALAWFALGLARHGHEELDAALAAFERSYGFYDAIDLDAGRAAALNQIGRALLGRREFERAAVALDRALVLNRRLGYPRGLANVLFDLGDLHATRGDWARAAAHHLESVETCAAVGDRWYLPLPLAGLAELVALRGEAGLAARLVGAIEAICGTPGITSWRWARPSHGRAVLVSRRGLAGAVWEAERTVGCRLGLDEVVSTARLAAAALGRAGSRAGGWKERADAAEETGGLSRRERAVLRLLVEGKTDREIGEALFVSHRTVQSHLARIFRKLDVHGRAEAAAEAVRRHLD